MVLRTGVICQSEFNEVVVFETIVSKQSLLKSFQKSRQFTANGNSTHFPLMFGCSSGAFQSKRLAFPIWQSRLIFGRAQTLAHAIMAWSCPIRIKQPRQISAKALSLLFHWIRNGIVLPQICLYLLRVYFIKHAMSALCGDTTTACFTVDPRKWPLFLQQIPHSLIDVYQQ